MAKSQIAARDLWSALTWDDLERWTDSRSVARGRAYQRGGRVHDLNISNDGALLATVEGTDCYVTRVALIQEGRDTIFDSECTCPVGVGCKHAVAVVAEYLQAVADGREIPTADEDDGRWAELKGEGGEFGRDWDDDDASWDGEEAEAFSPRKFRGSGSSRKPARRSTAQENWGEKIEQHVRTKSQSELAELVVSLTRRFPELREEFRERLALQEGDAARLVAEARREIRKVTSEPSWRNSWTGEGNTPDYTKARHRLERLLELGHADEVVALGREFIERGMRQIGQSDDEGETSTAFAECLPVVFQALARSSLSGPERLLFAIDAELADEFDTIGDASAAVFEACSKPEGWSAVADALRKRLKATPQRKEGEGERFARDYGRDQLTNWIAEALGRAGRVGEVRVLYESEVRATGSYERLVKFLLEQRCFDDAERWAKEGIAATSGKYPGLAGNLATSLCELARKRKQWDVVAAHAAREFFDHPDPSSFGALIKAAEKAGVDEAVRAAALRFLETGVAPYEVVAPPATNVATKTTSGRSSAKKRAAARTAPARASAPSEPAPPAARVKVDAAWPLPVPEYLAPMMLRPGRYGSKPRPHWDVLLEMAIDAKRPDEVLRWYDKMRADKPRAGFYDGGPHDYAERVAAAVSKAYPERAIAIYSDALNAQLPHAHQAAYEAAVGYLKKLRPIYEGLGRASEWTALVASIREKYRNRPLFMEQLDRAEGRTIVQSARRGRM